MGLQEHLLNEVLGLLNDSDIRVNEPDRDARILLRESIGRFVIPLLEASHEVRFTRVRVHTSTSSFARGHPLSEDAGAIYQQKMGEKPRRLDF
jgi:hypothetical protein